MHCKCCNCQRQNFPNTKRQNILTCLYYVVKGGHPPNITSAYDVLWKRMVLTQWWFPWGIPKNG